MKRKTKKIIVIAVIAAVLLGAGGGIWYWLGHRNADPVFVFPFEFVGNWYDYQKRYINSLDVTRFTDAPIYQDRARVSEVIVYERKNLLRKDAAISLYGDRMVLDEGQENEQVLHFNDVTAAACLGRNKLNVYHGKDIYQFKGGKRFNALKYVNLYFRYKHITRGEEHDQFLGL